MNFGTVEVAFVAKVDVAMDDDVSFLESVSFLSSCYLEASSGG